MPWETQSRFEDSFQIRSSSRRHRYRVLDRLTVDDLIENMAKAEAHLVNTGEDITYFPDKRVRQYLTKSNFVLG